MPVVCRKCNYQLDIAGGDVAYSNFDGTLCAVCYDKGCNKCPDKCTCPKPIQTEEKVQFKSGATGTKVPHLEYIPYSTLVALANRFELGLANHKENAWNSTQNTQKYMEDKEWVIARLVHVIKHSYKQIAIMTGQQPDDGDDNAGAILFGGSVLAAYNEYNSSKTK